MTRFWRTTLFTAGPGLLVCAAMGVVEFSDHRSLLIDAMGAYPLALLAFLPALPAISFSLLRAFPDRPRRSAPRIHFGWMLASWIAPFWHVLTGDLALRALDTPSPVRWAMVLRYSACLWFVAVLGRLCTMDRPEDGTRSAPRGTEIARETTPGTSAAAANPTADAAAGLGRAEWLFEPFSAEPTRPGAMPPKGRIGA